MLNRRALITNYNGIGDALIILPLLKALETSELSLQFYYITNPVFTTQEWMKWLGIKNLLGLYPVEWRHFHQPYWVDIMAFIEQNNIDLIINLRDESRQANPDYYHYKETMASSVLEFWDIKHTNFFASSHFTQNIIALFNLHNIDLSFYKRNWLKAYFDLNNDRPLFEKQIGFCTASSMFVKCWPIEHWIELGDILLASKNFIITIYPGTLPDEIAFANSITSVLYEKYSPDRCKIIVDQDLVNLARSLSTLDLLVTNDTFAVHLAAALEIPTVGLYFATDGRIWGGNSPTFTLVQSNFGLECPFMKREEGKCTYYFGGCPAPCKQEVTVQRAYMAIYDCIARGKLSGKVDRREQKGVCDERDNKQS